VDESLRTGVAWNVVDNAGLIPKQSTGVFWNFVSLTIFATIGCGIGHLSLPTTSSPYVYGNYSGKESHL
jgi:hypothetical protein